MFVNSINIKVLKNGNIIAWVKSKQALVFSIVDIELISFYLGLKIEFDWGKQIIKLL